MKPRVLCASCRASWQEVWGDDPRWTVIARRARRTCECWQCARPIMAGDGGGLLTGPVLIAAGRRGAWARTAQAGAAM